MYLFFVVWNRDFFAALSSYLVFVLTAGFIAGLRRLGLTLLQIFEQRLAFVSGKKMICLFLTNSTWCQQQLFLFTSFNAFIHLFNHVFYLLTIIKPWLFQDYLWLWRSACPLHDFYFLILSLYLFLVLTILSHFFLES